MKDLSFTIKGMHCAACSNAAQNAILKLFGVTSANVDLTTELAEVSFDDSKTDEGKIFAAVTAAGFTPKEKKSKGLFARFKK